MYGYVYETTNLVNGKKYIGKHKSEEFDLGYRGSGKHLWRAINKYGWDNFETRILCECFSEDELNSEEIFLIDYFEATRSKDYYNLRPGGGGGQVLICSEETREKMRLSHLGSNNHFFGKHHSEETRVRISISHIARNKTEETQKRRSEAMLGRKFSEEHRRKISEAGRRRKHSPETIEKLRQANLGKNLSDEHKQKISESWKHRTISDETRKKMSEAHKGRVFSEETRKKISESNKRTKNAKKEENV